MKLTGDDDIDMPIIKEWQARLEAMGVVHPFAFDEEDEPILDPNLKAGDVVFIPWAFPSLDKCIIEFDGDKVIAKGEYGTYELKYGPNWYIISGLD
jgi:hypothetical protein